MKFQLLAALVLFIAQESFALDQTLTNDLNIYQSRKNENGVFVYSYEMENNAISEINNIRFGSDCTNSLISKDYLPLEDTTVKGQTVTKLNFSIEAGSKWLMDFSNMEGDSKQKTSFVLALEEPDMATHSLKKGRFKLFSLKSKKNVDDAYLNQPFCIYGDGKSFLGFTKDEEWKDVDSKLDLQAVKQQCNALNVSDPKLKIKESSSLCANSLAEIQTANELIELNCLETAINKNRLANLETHKLLASVVKDLKGKPGDSGLKAKLKELKNNLASKIELRMETAESSKEVRGLQQFKANNFQILKRSCIVK